MAARSTVILTTGSAGSGKTYRRCARFLIDEFLPNETGKIISNYPVNREAIANTVSKRTGKDVQEILDRIITIPKDELDKWSLRWERRNSNRAEGPWSYFKDINIDGCHIAIDEIHNFCGTSTPKHQRQLWGNWLGEIRHRGATVEFLTQSPNKLADEIKWEASVRVSLINRDTKRDPIFKIPLGDWYEISGAFTGGYENKIDYIEKRCIDGKWIDSYRSSFTLDPYYFKFYDSFSAPHSGGTKASKQIHECQRRSKFGILLWFFLKHPVAILSRMSLFIFFNWLFFFGGGVKIINSFTNHLQQVGKTKSKVVSVKNIKETEPVLAAPVRYRPKPDRITDSNLAAENPLIAQQAQEIEQLKQQLDKASAVKLCTTDSVVFYEGYSYRIGEKIDYGKYEGKTVEKIDFARRIVYLSGDIVLRMGH